MAIPGLPGLIIYQGHLFPLGHLWVGSCEPENCWGFYNGNQHAPKWLAQTNMHQNVAPKGKKSRGVGSSKQKHILWMVAKSRNRTTAQKPKGMIRFPICQPTLWFRPVLQSGAGIRPSTLGVSINSVAPSESTFYSFKLLVCKKWPIFIEGNG